MKVSHGEKLDGHVCMMLVVEGSSYIGLPGSSLGCLAILKEGRCLCKGSPLHPGASQRLCRDPDW